MNKLMTFLILALLSLLASAGEIDTGNYFIEACGEAISDSPNKNYQGSAYCMGYITGAVITHNIMVIGYGADRLYCMPAGFSMGQSSRIVYKYMVDNPAKLHHEPGLLIIGALSDAFPCSGAP